MTNDMNAEAGDIRRPVRIALPNKGRLSDRALKLFEQAGLKAQFRADRALVASLGDDFQAIFVRASDIPEYLAESLRFHRLNADRGMPPAVASLDRVMSQLNRRY